MSSLLMKIEPGGRLEVTGLSNLGKTIFYQLLFIKG